MAKKILGQTTTGAAAWATLYTVPASKETVISTITICNQDSSAATFRIATRPAGATLSAEHYVAYDISVAANDTTTLTIGMTLAATDVLDVYSSATTVSFHAYGNETTV